MGKISEALKKSGNKEEGKRDLSQERREAATAPPAPPKEAASAATVVHQDRHAGNLRAAGSDTWDERLYKAAVEDDYLPEIFKTLRSRILHPGKGNRAPKTIMVTSAAAKEGKSFISANLGISIAQGLDQHCLLVNCDLRRPSLSSLFGVDGGHGLVDYLRDHVEIGTLLQKTSVNKLSILPSGKTPGNPAELLGSSRMRDLVPELAERYQDRFIIFDSPPVLVAAEAMVLTQLVDSVILVVREGVAGRYQVSRLIEEIGKEKILGLVFNGHTTNVIERSLMKNYDSYLDYSTQVST